MNFKNNLYTLLYSTVTLKGPNYISRKSVSILYHLYFIIIQHIVNYSLQHSSKTLDIEQVIDVIYTFFSYQNAKLFTDFMKHNKEYINKNLILQPQDTATTIKSITDRPFTFDYVSSITYLVQYIIHEIINHCNASIMNTIQDVHIVHFIHKDYDLYNIMYNVLNVHMIPRTNNYLVSKNSCKEWLYYICKQNKCRASKDLVQFMIDYINYKILYIIKKIHKQYGKVQITPNILNRYIYLL